MQRMEGDTTMKTRSILFAMMSLVLLLLAAACTRTNADSGYSSNGVEAYYQYEMIATHISSSPNSDRFIYQISNSSDHVYMFCGYDFVEGVAVSYGIEVYDNELNFVRRIDYAPYSNDLRIVSISVAPDGSYWTIEEGGLSPDASMADPKYSLLRHFDPYGVEYATVDLLDRHGIGFYFLGGTAEDGSVYICYGNRNIHMGAFNNIALIAANGELAAQWVDSFSDHIRIIVLGNGKTVVMQYGSNTPINQYYELMDNGAVKRIGEYGKSDVVASSEGNTVYMNSGQDLYRISLDTFEEEHVSNYANFETQLHRGEVISHLVVLQDDVIYGYINGRIYTFDKTTNKSITNAQDNRTNDDMREIIRIAMYGPNIAFDSAITNFNAENGEYRVVATDYSTFDTEPNGGIKQLNLEIISGNVPDLFLWGQMANVTGFDAIMYAQSGIFADLYEYLGNDADYSRDSFIPNIILALESSDGMLYELPFDFAASVVACSSSDISLEKWNYDEFYAELAKRPKAEFIYGAVTKEIVLFHTLNNNWDEYIDWRTRVCDFETESFVKLLEFCKSYVGDLDDLASYTLANEAIADGLQYLDFNVISNVSAIQKFKAMFNGDVTFIGFPTEYGRGNSIRLISSASIYNDSPYKDICWDLIRQFCGKEYQLENFSMFPTNADALEERFAYPEKYENTGGGVIYTGQNGEELVVTYLVPTEEEIDQVRELVYSLDRVYRQNTALMAIIFEDASAYFYEHRTAEETATIIQNRVSVYLSEQA